MISRETMRQSYRSNAKVTRNNNLGVWVYSGLSCESMYRRFKSMTDAVRCAIRLPGAIIFKNGEQIEYGVAGLNTAYYVNNRSRNVTYVQI